VFEIGSQNCLYFAKLELLYDFVFSEI